MQGGEYQMSGFCCCDGSGNRIKVTHLPHKDDVRILTERRTERISIGIGIQPDLPLVYDGPVMLM